MTSIPRGLFLALAAALVSTASSAAIRLGAPFTDGCVLQRGMPVNVWGFADPGEKVSVAFAGQSVTGVADATGRWSVKLVPLAASKESRDLTVTSHTSQTSQTSISDVLVGEVWIASGQSNMDLPIWNGRGNYRDHYGATVAAMANCRDLRVAQATRFQWSAEPRTDLEVKWRAASPDALVNDRYFSAVALYFARELRLALDCPVGILQVAWGGTNIEPWTPASGFAAVPGFEWFADIRAIPDADFIKGVFGNDALNGRHSQAKVLWNEMVAPLCPYSVKGFVWYQGCSNLTPNYAKRMHALYRGWSKEFGNPDLKLYFVQLVQNNSAFKQFEQLKFAAEEPNAEIVCISDVGNPADIHPAEKEIVGRRLAFVALAKDYGIRGFSGEWVAKEFGLKGVDPIAPTLKSARVEGGEFVLTFDHMNAWYVHNEHATLAEAFELAGPDGVWHPASPSNRQKGPFFCFGNEIRLKSGAVRTPVRARHLFKKPWKSSVFNEFALPLGPFLADVRQPGVADFTKEVDPFIGTAGLGHVTPAACRPFGMIQAGPDTATNAVQYECTWARTGGYQFGDNRVYRFSQTHISGTGVCGLGDIGLLPFTGADSGFDTSREMDKATERAEPGWYAVTLKDPAGAIATEVAAGEHTAAYRFRFPAGAAAKILLDPGWMFGPGRRFGCFGRPIYECSTSFDSATAVSGHQKHLSWVEGDVWYSLEFSRPVTAKRKIVEADGTKGETWVLEFGALDDGLLEIRLALSSVSAEGAKRNLAAEMPRFDFDGTRAGAKAAWNDILSRVELDPKTDGDVRKSFYAALYRACIQPNNIADVDGAFRTEKGVTGHAKCGKFYSTLSLWDTFRAAHPLYTILVPERVDGFVETMVEQYKAQGYLPIWALWGKDNHCMIGHHAVPVIVDAYLKNLVTYPAAEAWKAIADSLKNNHKAVSTATWGLLKEDWDLLEKYGYYPFDKLTGRNPDSGDPVIGESVSRLLECCYDDWCAARFAGQLGLAQEGRFFYDRSRLWTNCFDRATGFMRGRDSKGRWREPFDPLNCTTGPYEDSDFTEGNSWQYTWHVMQDVNGLKALMGGAKPFTEKLSFLFDQSAEVRGKAHDVSGLIGQYAHGNEVSHHTAYLFKYSDRPWRTAEIVREIFNTQYAPRPDGLCGNDDCGQMASWYVFSALGFYPMNPCGGFYEVGAPQVPGAIIRVPGRYTITIRAEGMTAKREKYVKALRVNENDITGHARVYHNDFVDGGEIVFEMSATETNGEAK